MEEIRISPWKWSTVGELLSSRMMENVLKNPNDYYFDIDNVGGCDEPEYIIVINSFINIGGNNE